VTYTAWGPPGGPPDLLKEGESPPTHPDEAGHVLLWRIEADSWEAACREYHRRQGWGPYVPMGESE
jgi:hypothetical protein